MVLALAVAGCTGPEPEGRRDPVAPADDAVVIEHGVLACPDPERRAEALFDRVTIPGLAAEQARFWGGGVTIGDFDRDGHQDLVLPGSDGVRLLRGDGAGDFTEVVDAVPALDWTFAAGAAAADFDGDGDLDLFVTRYGTSDTLLVNDGDGTFHDGTAAAGVGGPGGTWDQGAAWADLDLDGDLDLVVAGHGWFDDSGPVLIVEGPSTPSRLYESDGAGGFADRSDRLPEELQRGYTFVPGIVDLDGDPLPDLVFVNDFNGYWPSQGAVRRGDGYEWLPDIGLDAQLSGMGLGVGDVNEDGVDDFLVPAWSEVGLLLSVPAAGVWARSDHAAGVVVGTNQDFGWGGELVDLDDDGLLDAPVAFGYLDTARRTENHIELVDHLFQPDALYHRAAADQPFVDVGAAVGLADVGVGRGLAYADLDEDGWLDLVVRDLDGPTKIALSRCGTKAWLRVTLRGVAPNLDGIGAKVIATAGDRSQVRRIRAGGTSYLSQGPAEAWFGLDDAERVDLRVEWPDGAVTEAPSLPTRQWVEVQRDEALR